MRHNLVLALSAAVVSFAPFAHASDGDVFVFTGRGTLGGELTTNTSSATST